MQKKDEINYAGALGLILYVISFPANRETNKWTKDLETHYLKCFGKEKIQIIADSIDHYFAYKDIDLGAILPDIDVSVEEREKFLKFILEGFKQSGLVK